MSKTIRAWSISKLQVFEQCKYRAKLAWVDKIPDEQPRKAADRGSQLHLEAEYYVTGQGPITQGISKFTPDLDALRSLHKAGKVICEEEWGFNHHWEVCDWSRAWLRLKCDAVAFFEPKKVLIVDYKSGKRFGNEVKHAVQLQLYALCALIRYPEIEQVFCELWYLDQNELASFTMHRSQMEKYLNYFNRRGVAMTSETVFKPNPNIVSCKYCPYHSSKQGNCKFGVVIDVENNALARKEVAIPETLTPEQEAKRAKLLARLG